MSSPNITRMFGFFFAGWAAAGGAAARMPSASPKASARGRESFMDGLLSSHRRVKWMGAQSAPFERDVERLLLECLEVCTGKDVARRVVDEAIGAAGVVHVPQLDE